MQQIYDPIRKKWVIATAEELVRQYWLQLMIRELSFPSELLVVEQELDRLPHLCADRRVVPSRRVDILSFFRSEEDRFLPLLLVECKRGVLDRTAVEQLYAYNTFVQAAYIALVNQKEVIFFSFSDKLEFDRFPSYRELVEKVNG